MKSTIGLLLFSMVLYSCSEVSKKKNDIPDVKVDEYIWLDNNYSTLMDNALRCFRLHSIGSPSDSSIRLWNTEIFYPASSKTNYLNMFELDIKSERPYATYYNLEYKAGRDSQCIVTCVRKTPVQPHSGWVVLKKKMEELELNRIDTLDDQLEPDNIIMEGMLNALQYVYGETTITVDFTIYADFLNSKSSKLRRYYEMIKLVRDEFAVNLFVDHSGYDSFKNYSK